MGLLALCDECTRVTIHRIPELKGAKAMSEEELVQGYISGRVTRRVLLRGLVAAGLSVVAASAFAL